MEKPSNEPQDPQLDTDLGDFLQDKVCSLAITVDKNNELTYQINWSPDESGLAGAASVFYSLLFDDLGLKIFEEMKQQCVINNAEMDYLAISKIMHSFLESQQANTQTNDEVVVPPDQIFSI